MNSKYNDTHIYDDIINLPHHVSDTHSQMSMHDRAAQFAPFAALTGYGSAIDETTRLTEEKYGQEGSGTRHIEPESGY